MNWAAVKQQALYDWRAAWKQVAATVYGQWSPEHVREINRRLDVMDARYTQRDVEGFESVWMDLNGWLGDARTESHSPDSPVSE